MIYLSFGQPSPNTKAQTGSGPQALGASRAYIHRGLESMLYLGLTTGVFVSTLRIPHCGTEVVEGLLNQGRAHAAISIVASTVLGQGGPSPQTCRKADELMIISAQSSV